MPYVERNVHTFRKPGVVILFNNLNAFWYILSEPSRKEITLASPSCEQSLLLSHTCFRSFFLISLFFPSLSSHSPSASFATVCHFYFFLPLPVISPLGPHKDSRESLTYDGEEKEVRERIFEINASTGVWFIVCQTVLLRMRGKLDGNQAEKERHFVTFVDMWVTLYPPACPVWYTEHADVGAPSVVWLLISFGGDNKVAFYHSS